MLCVLRSDDEFMTWLRRHRHQTRRGIVRPEWYPACPVDVRAVGVVPASPSHPLHARKFASNYTQCGLAAAATLAPKPGPIENNASGPTRRRLMDSYRRSPPGSSPALVGRRRKLLRWAVLPSMAAGLVVVSSFPVAAQGHLPSERAALGLALAVLSMHQFTAQQPSQGGTARHVMARSASPHRSGDSGDIVLMQGIQESQAEAPPRATAPSGPNGPDDRNLGSGGPTGGTSPAPPGAGQGGSGGNPGASSGNSGAVPGGKDDLGDTDNSSSGSSGRGTSGQGTGDAGGDGSNPRPPAPSQ
jgi:hypothetical protein